MIKFNLFIMISFAKKIIMKHIYFLFLLLTSLSLTSQTSVGNVLYGTAAFENFGKSIGMANNGDRIAVGSPYNNELGNHSGNIKIYDWINGAWVLTGNIYGPANSYMGTNVNISENGKTVIATTDYYIGTASQNICVYELQNNVWNMTWNLVNYGSSNLTFGSYTGVSDDGNTITHSSVNIGGTSNSANGRVFILRKINNVWTEIGLIQEMSLNIGNGNYFGHTTKLSPDGNKIFISAPIRGSLYSYQYSNGQWTQYGGEILESNNGSLQFGKSFSINSAADILAVGNTSYNNMTTKNGAVTFYSLVNGSWTKKGQITGTASQFMGTTVSISDNNLVAISNNTNNLNQNVSGSLTVYKFDLTNQTFTKLGATLNAEYLDYMTINDISKTSNKVVTAGFYANNPNNIRTGYVKTFGYDAFLNTKDVFADKKSVNVYPNPTKGRIYFDDSENKIISVKVFNASQQLILEKDINSNEKSLDLPSSATLYFVTFYLKDATTLTKKIIVQ